MKSNQLSSLVLDNRYQVQQKLSHKAGRQTLLAKDLKSQELVIIKLLQFDSLFEWDDLKLFEREAKTLKNLNHPAIPKYLDYFEVEARRGNLTKCNRLVEIDNEQIRGFALVQTYIDAPSLQDTIQQGRKFTEAELIELAQKLLAILDYLHSSNPPVIHRDIKPSNILLSNRTGNSIGELYLVDFGSVQTAASKGEGTITIVGSYGYIPLEQFGGQTTTASDLYSLGMTLIYIITGVHPAELPQTDGRVKFNSSQIGNGLQRWLVKMTEPYLDKRFDSAKSAQAALLAKDNSGGLLNLKPHITEIKLYRDRYKLEIVFKQVIEQQSSGEAVYIMSLFGFGVVFVILRLYGLIWFPWFPFLIYAVWLLIKVYSKSTSRFPSRTHYQVILIDKNRSVKSASYYDQKPKQLNWHSVYTADRLNLIVFNPGYVFDKYLDDAAIQNGFGQIEIPQQLSLYANEQEYVIGNQRQSKAELFWLGKEISDFLGLQLVIYPTIENTAKTHRTS